MSTRLATSIGKAFGMLLDRGFDKDTAYQWVLEHEKKCTPGLVYLDELPNNGEI